MAEENETKTAAGESENSNKAAVVESVTTEAADTVDASRVEEDKKESEKKKKVEGGESELEELDSNSNKVEEKDGPEGFLGWLGSLLKMLTSFVENLVEMLGGGDDRTDEVDGDGQQVQQQGQQQVQQQGQQVQQQGRQVQQQGRQSQGQMQQGQQSQQFLQQNGQQEQYPQQEDGAIRSIDGEIIAQMDPDSGEVVVYDLESFLDICREGDDQNRSDKDLLSAALEGSNASFVGQQGEEYASFKDGEFEVSDQEIFNQEVIGGLKQDGSLSGYLEESQQLDEGFGEEVSSSDVGDLEVSNSDQAGPENTSVTLDDKGLRESSSSDPDDAEVSSSAQVGTETPATEKDSVAPKENSVVGNLVEGKGGFLKEILAKGPSAEGRTIASQILEGRKENGGDKGGGGQGR